MDIFLIRHGEMAYEENAAIDLDLINSYATGTREGPLSSKGMGQAQRVAGFLLENKVRFLYSSAFIRAHQSAEETSKVLGAPIEIVKDFGELNVGRFAPETDPRQAQVFKGFRALHKVLPHLIGSTLTNRLLGYFFVVFYFRSWYAGKTIAGESPDNALARIQSVFNALLERHGSTDVVAVFTHGYFIHLLVNHVLDPKGALLRILKTPYIRNGSITHITRTRKGGWKVKSYAQTIHLR